MRKKPNSCNLAASSDLDQMFDDDDQKDKNLFKEISVAGSRQYGWRWGIILGVMTGTGVFAINVSLIVVAMLKGNEKGIATLLFKKEQKLS